MPRLPQNFREQAIGMLTAGRSQTQIARHFGVARSTICRLQHRFRQTGSTRDRPRPGAPRVTTPRQDRYIRLTHLRNRFQTAVTTAMNTPGRNNPRISAKTVLRRLRGFGLRPYRAYMGPVLNDRRRLIRRQWANNHSGNNWPRVNWNRVVFSDESRFLLHRNDRRFRVYRFQGERYQQPCVREVDRFGGGSTMVWGAIRFGWKSRLLILQGNLTAPRYHNNVLEAEVLPHFAQNPNDIFMQDNARPHVAQQCMDALQANNIRILPWPPYSPDMNPIEHLWDFLDRRVRARNPPPVTHAQLRQALIEEWNRFPQWKINRLITSMPRRINSLIRARGGHTRY